MYRHLALAVAVLAASFVGGYGVGTATENPDLIRAGVEAAAATTNGTTEAAFFLCESGDVGGMTYGSPPQRGVNPWPNQPPCDGWQAMIHTHPTTHTIGLSHVDRRIPDAMPVEYVCALSLGGLAACTGPNG